MSKTVAKADRPTYLANVLSIAKVDGDVAGTESLVLRSVIRGIGASQEDVVAAGALLGSGGYKMRLPKSLNERMNNLQDMVMVALADGDVSPMESAPIEQMAKAMRYTQADIDLCVRRAENALRRIGRKPQPGASDRKPPPVPREPARPPARVLPQEIAPPPIPKPAPTEPTEPVKATPEPKPQEPEPPSKEEKAPPVSQEEAPRKGLPKNVKACMECRARSASPETYCFGLPEGPINPWGCRLSNMQWTPGAAWLGLGQFRDEATFVFDKHTIAERLTANLSAPLNCPHLDTTYTEAAFDCLPNRASVGERWHYRDADASDPDAVTLKTTRYVHGCPVSSSVTTDGIDPVGSRAALLIIRKAAKRTGRRLPELS
jgi:uncharacterized tellurite resistance protein B-like protein